jgi:protease-4
MRTESGFQGTVDVRLPPATDPGPMVPTIVRAAPQGPGAPRVAVVDVDGLIVNQNLTGLYSVGENPVSAFREKLEAAAADARVRALVLRIHSPGGGVAASDLLAEELQRFRTAIGKPVVACLMDVATGGAYYLAVGCDRIVALPTTITGAVGAIINHPKLQNAMGQVSVAFESIKSGELVDMGSITEPLDDNVRALFQQMADGFRDRFAVRVARCRPAMTVGDRRAISDGRVIAGPQALALHMVDSLGYLEDALCEAERLAGIQGAEVVLFQRRGYPTRSIYSIIPNVPLQGELVPASYPGLERSKLPTFLYLWQPDPTLTKGGR